jgi:hypothetical protein
MAKGGSKAVFFEGQSLHRKALTRFPSQAPARDAPISTL